MEAFILVSLVIGLVLVSVITSLASFYLIFKLNLFPGKEMISFDSNGRVIFNQNVDLNRIHLTNNGIKEVETITGNVVLQTSSSRLSVNDEGIEISAPNGFQVVSPETGRKIFPPDFSSLSLPSSLSSLSISGGVTGVKKIRSPVDQDLEIRGSSIKMRGNQGVDIRGKTISIRGEQISLSSLNGSVIFDAADGIYLRGLPAYSVEADKPESFPVTVQYKVCVCGKSGRLFKLHMKTAETTCADVRFPESRNPCI